VPFARNPSPAHSASPERTRISDAKNSGRASAFAEATAFFRNPQKKDPTMSRYQRRACSICRFSDDPLPLDEYLTSSAASFSIGCCIDDDPEQDHLQGPRLTTLAALARNRSAPRGQTLLAIANSNRRSLEEH